jgi:DNA-binding GntR family transcriptional regulator
MKSAFEVTRELEGYATRLAAERITDQKIEELEAIVERLKKYDIAEDYKKIIQEDENFHEIIIESSNNPCLIEILYGLHMHTQRMWLYAQPDISEMGLFLNTMPNIINALKVRNIEQADEAAKVHIDVFVERIKQELL